MKWISVKDRLPEIIEAAPGPWYADKSGNIWRRDPKELYENGGEVAGGKPIATVNKGWYGPNDTSFPVEANANLIAAAPDLLEALIYLRDRIESGQEPGMGIVHRAINKATGGQS